MSDTDFCSYEETRLALDKAVVGVEEALPPGHGAVGHVEFACKAKLLLMLQLGAENPLRLASQLLVAPIELLDLDLTAMEALGFNSVMGLMALTEQAAREEGHSYLYAMDGQM